MKIRTKLTHPFALGLGGFVAGVALFTAAPQGADSVRPAQQPTASYQLPQA